MSKDFFAGMLKPVLQPNQMLFLKNRFERMKIYIIKTVQNGSI